MTALAHTPPIAAQRDASSPAAPGGARPRTGASGAGRMTGTAAPDPVRRTFHARVHTDLAAIAPAWHAMQADGACLPYQRIEWIGLVVAHLATGVSPLFVEVSDAAAGRPLLILPMVRIRHRTHAAVEWLDLGRVNEIPVRGSRTVPVEGGEEVAVFRTSDDKVFALVNRCPL